MEDNTGFSSQNVGLFCFFTVEVTGQGESVWAGVQEKLNGQKGKGNYCEE